MSKSGAEGDLKSPSDELADYVVQVGEIHRQFQKHDSEHDFSRATEKTPLLGDEDEQKRVMQAQLVDGHLRNNEHLILERDADIRDIEQSIHQVNEIFRDLGTIVHEQQFLVGKYGLQSVLTRLYKPSETRTFPSFALCKKKNYTKPRSPQTVSDFSVQTILSTTLTNWRLTMRTLTWS